MLQKIKNPISDDDEIHMLKEPRSYPHNSLCENTSSSQL